MEISAFLLRCDGYCGRKKTSRARLSTILFGSGVTLARLAEGRGVTVRVLNRASERLDALETQLTASSREAA